jgi:benzoyl-CoA reductase subunit D
MIFAGVDVGAKTCKGVILEGGRIAGRATVPSGYDLVKTVDQALAAAGVARDDIARIVATGAGAKAVRDSAKVVSEVTAAARGAGALDATVRTVIDVGAEEARAIKLDAQGSVVDQARNDKCAAGAGAFTEAMARALEVKLDRLGPLSLQSTQVVPMNARCVVFAESDLVSLIHARTPKADIARAVHDAIADRIASLVRRVGVAPKIMLIGGVANNVGLVESLERALEADLIIPDDPEFVSAFGAALIAAAE